MARIYSTRQFLDPRYIDMMNQSMNRRLDTSRQDRANVLGALSNAIGSAASSVGRYIDEERGKESRRSLLGSYDTSDPLKAAAADKFIQTGDPSAMMNIDQAEKTFQARQDEEATRKNEEVLLKKQIFENAVEDIDTYRNDPDKKIAAINRAISKGLEAGVDVSDLKLELQNAQEEKGKAEFIIKEKEFEKQKETKQSEIKKRTKDLIDEYVSRLEDIEDKDEYNQSLNELKTMAEANGLRSEIKWPDEKKKSRTQRTAKEEDEYQALLLDKKYNRMTIEKQQRLDKLSKLTPYKS